MSNGNDRNVRKVTAFLGKDAYNDEEIIIRYADTRLLGNGSFGVVYQAKLVDTNEWVAIKKVLQDRRYKNRELTLMRRLDHQNVVRLLYFFYSKGDRPNEEFLNLVLEFLPDTVYRVTRGYGKVSRPVPLLLVKVFMYQLFRALAYLHSLGICHRDVKPQNLLVHSDTAVLKLCDFGSAKYLIHGEPNVSYICSRYYRAPELIFGSTDYSTTVDIWSAGCVFGELLLGRPMFAGETGIDQLVEIIKVLGTPTKDQIASMNPNYAQFSFPKIKSQPWNKYFEGRAPNDAIALISIILEYSPMERLFPLRALAHNFFDELRVSNCRLPNGRELPPLFNFSQTELEIEPSLNSKLIPKILSDKTTPSSDSDFDRTASDEDSV